MKLYAIIENEEGKQVKIGSNERITATLYEGNKKQYAVNIEWTDVSDLDNWECPECGYFEDWDNYEDGTPICPKCDIDMKHNKAVMGSIITTQEWRNEPDERREMNCRTIQNFGEQHPLFHSQKMKDWRKGKKQQGEKQSARQLMEQSAKDMGLIS